MRLLIVEDDRLVEPAMRAVLKREGHHVANVETTPVKANRLARRARADLALIDLKLANGGNGLDTARQLREEFGVVYLIMRIREIGKTALGILHKPLL